MQQQELFEIETPQTRVIPGFLLKENYITPAEELELLSHIDIGPWQNDYRRRIQQYGLGYGAERGGTPVWVRDFPDWLGPLGQRVARDAGFDCGPENCVINEYMPPQGIAPHIDYPAFGPAVACVSLGSDVLLDLIPPERSERVSIHVPARSFWVVTGEARSHWQHGIAPRLTDLIRGERRKRGRRVSITFRTARR